MSVSVQNVLSALHSTSTEGPSSYRTPPHRRDSGHTMFGSLRKKLSRKDSNPLSSTNTSRQSTILSSKSVSRNSMAPLPPTNNPLTSFSPATRRPDRAGMNAFTTPSNEPPPAYSPASNAAPMAPAPVELGTNRPMLADDRYAFLSSFDTIFLIDDSGSMAGRSWRETGKALETITPICTAHDADGIDIYFLNKADNQYYHNVVLPSTVTEIFTSVRPGGGTPTGQRLNSILRPYLQRYTANPETTKPVNIIVITDGEPSDDVESVIIHAAKRLDKLDAPAWQVGIQFFQVGKEPGAKEHLKSLDDELAAIAGDDDLRDIVDTVPYTGVGDSELNAEGILKVVLGSVNKRLDRKSSKELHRTA
ncbi:hypothetical protein BU16DRAFT_617212 [Lophium mytilinum]|uniref:VWFA domain-containing protein n=1 Tax=Lophium mytilinum TaxID=390894 RepID=A0A6A6QZP6_9PEZI|nr:hypothetical protein BU16DRAFT_617212 [Lophium mytilinum]